MEKEKLGKYIFYGSLIASIIVLAIGLILTTVNDNLDDTQAIRIKFIIVFYALNFLISLGSIIKEILSGSFARQKLIIKIVIASLVLIIGTIFIFVLPSPLTAQIVTLVGMVVLFYILVPTVKQK